MRFLYKEQKLVLWRQGLFFSFLCECVPCSYDATAAKSPLFEVNSIQFRGKEKFNLLSLVYVFQKKKNGFVRSHEKNSGETVRRLGTIMQSIFVPNQAPASAWIFGNSSVRVGTQGLFCPYLKTFVPPFLPTRLTAPGSPRMRKGPIIGILGRVVQSRVKITMVRAKFEFRYESLKSKFSFILFPCNLMIGFSKKNRENNPIKCFWTKEKETQVKI